MKILSDHNSDNKYNDMINEYVYRPKIKFSNYGNGNKIHGIFYVFDKCFVEIIKYLSIKDILNFGTSCGIINNWICNDYIWKITSIYHCKYCNLIKKHLKIISWYQFVTSLSPTTFEKSFLKSAKLNSSDNNNSNSKQEENISNDNFVGAFCLSIECFRKMIFNIRGLSINNNNSILCYNYSRKEFFDTECLYCNNFNCHNIGNDIIELLLS